MPDPAKPPLDLKTLLAEATPPSAHVTVPLKQGLAEQIRQAEADLTTQKGPKRMAAKSRREVIEALREEMAASALTFHFEGLSDEERESIRKAMGGRDEPDEMNLRAIAAMCKRVVAADGTEFTQRMTWEDFRDLRKRLTVRIFDESIDAAATRASGGDWSAPL